MSSISYLAENTRVHFTLASALPILSERYESAQAGSVVLKGFFNQTAHMQLLDGTRYRTLAPRQDDERPDRLAYPIVGVPAKVELCRVRVPIRRESASTPMRYTVVLDEQEFVFKQIGAARHGFELWDGSEMHRLVRREPSTTLLADLTLLIPVPTILVLLFPWLESQILPSGKT
jgi:hypothetical protein